MKAVRIELSQNSANYRKGETVVNKMTYPLPPFSTVIGAIHAACKFTEYQPMDISIQGDYGSMQKMIYKNHCFHDKLENDRATLVHLQNQGALNRYASVAAYSTRKTGTNYITGEFTEVVDSESLDEFRYLKTLPAKLSSRKKRYSELIDKRISTLKSKMETSKKNNGDISEISRRLKQIESFKKQFKGLYRDYENKIYRSKIDRYALLTTAPMYYEILTEINLVIHVRCKDESLLDVILDNVYNIKSIGRSEDFVDVKNASIVELTEGNDGVRCYHGAYLDSAVVTDLFSPFLGRNTENGELRQGTRFKLQKNYEIVDKKRVFEYKDVFYVSDFSMGGAYENVFYDLTGKEPLVVNFV